MKNRGFLLLAASWYGVCIASARFATLFVTIGLVACAGSAQTHLYTLSFDPMPLAAQQSKQKDKGAEHAFWDIELAPIELPTQVARVQIVLVQAPGELMLDERARWAAPLQDEMHLALQQALSGHTGASVSKEADTQAGTTPFAYRIKIEIQRFSSALSESDAVPGYASIRAVWRLTWVGKKDVEGRDRYAQSKLKKLSSAFSSSERHCIKGVSDFTQTFTQAGYAPLVLAHQHLIERLANDILRAISDAEKAGS